MKEVGFSSARQFSRAGWSRAEGIAATLTSEPGSIGKLGRWKNGAFQILAATRYGRSAFPLTDSIVPINARLINPATSGAVTAVLALNYIQILPLHKSDDQLSLSVGKYDVPDPFLGGEGLTELSSDLKDATDPLGRLRSDQGLRSFRQTRNRELLRREEQWTCAPPLQSVRPIASLSVVCHCQLTSPSLFGLNRWGW